MSMNSNSMPGGNVIHEITPLSERACFYVVDRYKKEFDYPMHCHSEYELNFVEHASGVRRVVGDNAEIIGEYDLVLITGRELEHVWEQADCHSENIHEITIQFAEDTLGQDLLNKTQFAPIKRMIERAKRGLAFPMDSILKIYNALVELPHAKPSFQSFISFLQILHQLALCDDSYELSSSAFARMELESESRRVSKVQKYLSEHYRDNVRLNDVAELVGMTPVAFSRFFHLRTGKTLSDYIIEHRLGRAARLLVDSTMSVAEISYDCGFNTLSNFNRLFKRSKGCTPKEFRENYFKRKIIV